MTSSITSLFFFVPPRNLSSWSFVLSLFFAVLFSISTAYGQITTSPDQKELTVDDAPEMQVFSFGKTVTIKQQAQGVLAFGGDIIIEGSVSGDVAVIGGSVTQRDNAYIGGDVIVIGGKYKPDRANPLREEGKQTIMIAGYEEELRNLAQNPSAIFAPSFSLAFLAQRTLSVLFWFVVSLGLATIAPGAVSRAIARFKLTTLKIFAVGIASFLLTSIVVVGSMSILPNYLSAILGLMAFALLILAYVFGRVALHLSVGKFLQKRFLSERNRSETLAIFIGVIFWTLLLSIPYVWTLALLALFSAGIGLVLTARSKPVRRMN